MVSISLRTRLLGGVAVGLGALLAPQQAMAGCVTTTVQNPNDGILCATSGTSQDSWDGQNPPNDRLYFFDATGTPSYLTINSGVTIDGFGLAWTDVEGGDQITTVTNNGLVQVGPGNNPTLGNSSAALDIYSNGGSVIYTGTGDIENISSGNGLGVRVFGSNTTSITSSGSIQSLNATGIWSVTDDGANSIVSTGYIGGGELGIYAEAANGAVSIASADTRGGDTGIVAYTTGGSIDIVTTDLAYGGYNAIEASTVSGAITISSTGLVVGEGYEGIHASTQSGSIDISVGDVFGAENGVAALSGTGPITISTTGDVNGGWAGIYTNSAGVRTIDVGANSTLSGTTGVYTTGAGATNITNDGTIEGDIVALIYAGSGGGTIVNNGHITSYSADQVIDAFYATDAITITNNGGATIDGRVVLGAGDDLFTNSGVWSMRDWSEFGDGDDVLTNNASGVINLTGDATLAYLEGFNQNGRLNLDTYTLDGDTIGSLTFVNGAAGTVDTNGDAGITGFAGIDNRGVFDLAEGDFWGSGGAFTNGATGIVRADEGVTYIGGQSSFANNGGRLSLADGADDDLLIIGSDYVGTAGHLALDVGDETNEYLIIGGAASGSTTVDITLVGTGTIDSEGVLIVDTESSSANAFTLGALSGNRNPLMAYRLEQRDEDYYLTSLVNAAGLRPLALTRVAGGMWYQSANELAAQLALPVAEQPNGLELWGHLYANRDKSGERDAQVVGGTAISADNRLRNHRTGGQMGVGAGVGPTAALGLTAGWERNKASGDADFTSKAWNIGAYARFGGAAGLRGYLIAKHDSGHVQFDDALFADARVDASSSGLDGNIGYRWAMAGSGSFGIDAGLAQVHTKIDDVAFYGFNYDYRPMNSTRARAAVRYDFGGKFNPYVALTGYREFDNQGLVTLSDGANSYDLTSRGKGSWARLEGGIGGDGLGAGPILSLWAEAGDVKGVGARLGFRFGGKK